MHTQPGTLPRDLGHDAIVVVGHPEYYPKFGFLPASRYGLHCEYDVPEDVFMALLKLRSGALQGSGSCSISAGVRRECNRGVAVLARSSAGTVTTASSKPTVFPRKRE